MTGGGRKAEARGVSDGAAGRPGAGGRGRPGGGSGHPGGAAGRLRAGGGVIVPVLTRLLAFFVGGLVVLFTGHNPISTYKAIFNGTGLNWLFPWITGDERDTSRR